MLKVKKKGILIVISSPSGAGKSTIAKKLLKQIPNIKLSVSVTTRKPRDGEINGVDYEFVSKTDFQKKLKKKDFLEFANVFGNYYGTLKSDVYLNLKKGKSILLDIDWQGARQVKKKFTKNIVSIFVLPPSIKELKNRLTKRENNKVFIKNRMGKAKREIMHWSEYDYAIVNDELQSCIEKIKNIIDTTFSKPHMQILNKTSL